MPDYLGPPLNPTALIGCWPAPQKPESGTDKAIHVHPEVLFSDWVLYIASAMFVADTIVIVLIKI